MNAPAGAADAHPVAPLASAARLPSVEVLDGVAEEIPVASGSVDAVVVGQAFHWFDEPFHLPYVGVVHWCPPELQLAVLSWAERERRDLPWRRTRDPWAVLVSEVMLQQTQVPRVIPRYRAFLARFPTAAACATAPAGDVVAEWTGLGYNRRALRLHAAAKAVVEEHGGCFPSGYGELVQLPGVGPYTARAVLAFAFERDVAVVDTNVARVLARVGGRRLTGAEVQRAADAAVPHGEAWAWNQAMLDVGATCCRPRNPRCDACPLQAGCRWWASGRREPDPAVGSAGVSGGQSRFDGSDRQGRGRLVAALCQGPVAVDDLDAAMGWHGQHDRAARVAATLVADGLATRTGSEYRLPT